MSRRAYPTWTEIDLDAIRGNARYFADNSDAGLMAVVKADGYGHGAVPAMRAALSGGASWGAVARVEEALFLREAGETCPILVLGITPIERMAEMVGMHVSMTVWEEAQVEAAATAGEQVGETARLHLKVDTGMSRLGVAVEKAGRMLRHMTQSQHVVCEGLFTHFARADEPEPGPTDTQESVFRQLVGELESSGLRPPIVHAANSAAALARESAHFDLVRVGISLYGMHPSKDCQAPPPVRPALTWKAHISQVKMVPPGRGVSYGHEYVTQREERIGTLPVGYADGFRRTGGNQVLVRGRRVPIVGRVCMDMCMVQLDSVPEAQPGDEVVMIGSQGAEHISAEEVAVRWGTINYEVTCGIGKRVPRLHHRVEGAE